MKTRIFPSCKAAITTLLLAAIISLAPARPAHAYGEGAFAAGILTIWMTYVTAKTLICTPVAAFKAQEHKQGFTGAFRSCWHWHTESSDSNSAPAAQDNAPSGSNASHSGDSISADVPGGATDQPAQTSTTPSL